MQLLEQPGNSLLWIRYMALQVSLTEVDAARRVAERALASISFRDEQDKLNVWYVNEYFSVWGMKVRGRGACVQGDGGRV